MLLRVCVGLLLLLSVPACQNPTPGAQTPLLTENQSQIPGRLLLPAGNRHLVLKQGTLTITAGTQTLAEVEVRENRFVLPVLKQPGPYTYRGQGEIARLQQEAVPIGGSQGGIVPIGGSQGGLHAGFEILQTPAFAEGQTIAFEGQILENLTQLLPQLDIAVPEAKITVLANQSIVNTNTTVKDSIQAVVTGNNQGPVTIVNDPSPMPTHRQPIIRSVRVTPPGPVAPGATITLEVDVIVPDGDVLQCRWNAERGTLSSDRGTSVTWTAMDAQGDLPNVLFIEVEITDSQNNKDKSRVGIVIEW